MAQVISAGPGVGISEGIRASINHQYFVEAIAAESISEGVSCKIRSGIGAAIIEIDSWSPDDGDFNVEPMHSAKAVMHAATGVIEKEILFDAGTEFDDGGTHNQTVATTYGIELAENSPGTGFEDYTVGLTLQDASQPESWFKTSTQQNFSVVDNAYNVDGQHVYCQSGNNNTNIVYDEAGTFESGEVRFQFMRVDNGNQYVTHSIMMNVTGSGTAMRGHMVGFGGQYVQLRRITSSTSSSSISGSGLINNGYNGPEPEEWWWGAVRFVANGSGTTTYYAKNWQVGNSEPSSWTWLYGDTAYVSAGWVGIDQRSGYYNGYGHYDNFLVTPIPSNFYSSGDWTSDPLDTTDLINYSYAGVTWDETAPTDTVASVFARWRNGGSWLACTNGGEVPGITAGEDTTAGSSKDSLEFKVELETTDPVSTPMLENLRFYHVPLDPNGIEIVVDGRGANVPDGTLEVWGIKQVIAAANDEAWDNVTAETFLPWGLSDDAETIVVQLTYGGWLIDEILYQLVAGRWQTSDPHIGAYFSLNPIKYASAPVEARWNCQEKWAPMGKNYEWVLIDYSMGMRADASYLVGHIQLDDFPGSIVAAALSNWDHPGSLQVEGWKRDDHPGSLLAQAWQRDDQPGMVMPGVITSADQPGMIVVAVRAIHDQPGSIQVMGVNRDGHIEVTIVDAAAWAELAARGYTRG